MDGEHVEEKDHPNNMFAKLHQTHKFQQPSTLTHQHHQLQVTGDREAPEEVTSRSPGSATATTTTKREIQLAQPTINTTDGATIEIVRRPRGRPPGSKNKPKPPIVITRDSEPSMSAYVLELPGGVDIVDCVTHFCRKRNMGLCVLTGSGTVANVTLRQLSTTPGATVTFHGHFEILSISARVLPPSMTYLAAMANGFTISLAGPQGQVVGGSVMGALVAAGTVYLIAATFNSPSFHRLPLEDEGSSGSGGNEGQESPPAVSGGGGGGDGRHPPAAVGSRGMSIYSSHLPSDVIWAPTARQPPPPPPY